MNISCIDHVGIRISKESTSLEFYKKLGFLENSRQAAGNGRKPGQLINNSLLNPGYQRQRPVETAILIRRSISPWLEFRSTRHLYKCSRCHLIITMRLSTHLVFISS